MSVPVLNLLRQPQASPWWRLWPAGLLGAWLGAALGLACHAQLPALRQAQAERQALAATQAQQRTQAKTQRQAQAQQAALLREAQARWQVQQHWHATLSALAQEQGMRVQVWQGDAQQLQLQAWLPQGRAVSELLAALNAAGPSPWRLHSLRPSAGAATDAGAGAGVWLQLQAQLPVASLRATPAQTGRAEQHAAQAQASGSAQERP